MTTAYCTFCGAAVSLGSGACPGCGQRVGGLDQLDPSGGEQWGLWSVGGGLAALVLTTILITTVAFWLLLPACDATGGPPADCRDKPFGIEMSLPAVTLISTIVLGIAQVTLVWMLAFRRFRPSPRLLGFTRPQRSRWQTGGAVLVAIFASVGFAHLYGLTTTALGWDFLTPPELEPDLVLPGALAALSFVALAIWTPLVEEAFFRGFVFRGLVNRWGSVAGLVLSAAVFTGMHFSLPVLLPIFVTGLLLGGLYWYTRSLWPSIIMHGLQNGLAVLLAINLA